LYLTDENIITSCRLSPPVDHEVQPLASGAGSPEGNLQMLSRTVNDSHLAYSVFADLLPERSPQEMLISCLAIINQIKRVLLFYSI
jgi:hypothetical protein